MLHDNSESLCNDWKQKGEINEWILQDLQFMLPCLYARFVVNRTEEELLVNYMIVKMATEIVTKKS